MKEGTTERKPSAVRQYLMTTEVKKIIVLFLQSLDDVLVLFHNFLNALNAQILDALRPVDDFHQSDDLFKPFCERVELAEDVVLAVIDVDKPRYATFSRPVFQWDSQ